MLQPIALVGLSVLAAPAQAPGAQFAAYAARICVYSGANLAVVRQMAKAENWTAMELASVPGKSPTYILDGKAFTRTHAWRLQKGAATYWVGLFDVPGQPTLRDCSLATWDVDFEAVDAVFRGSGPALSESSRKIPFRMFDVPKGMFGPWKGAITISLSSYGTKRLNIVSVTPTP